MKKTVDILDINDIKTATSKMLNLGIKKELLTRTVSKSIFRVTRLENINNNDSTIICQEMFMSGGECLILDKNTLSNHRQKHNLILFGTLNNYEILLSNLRSLYTNHKSILEHAKRIEHALLSYDDIKEKKTIPLKKGEIRFGERTIVMGIINITPDSFSDGGLINSVEKAIEVARDMKEKGVDIIDIGGESSRPGANKVEAEEEIKRVLPVLKAIRSEIKNIFISIDTYKRKVAEKALENGADIVNDISALRFDKEMVSLISDFKVPVILMHMQGTPKTMQIKPFYKINVCDYVKNFFEERLDFATSKGIDIKKIILDVGIGFGKTVDHNIELIRRLKEFKIFNCPLLIGTSRKSFIGSILGEPVDKRLEGSISSVVISVLNGADIVRVHDYEETIKALKLINYIYK